MNKKIASELAIGIILILAIIFGGIFYWKNKNIPNENAWKKYNEAAIKVEENSTGNNNTNESESLAKDNKIEIVKYKSQKLGIYFEYPKTVGKNNVVVVEKDNKITLSILSEEDKLYVYSKGFDIKKNEKVSDAIFRLFSNGNKNCIVVKKDISGGVFNEIKYDEKNPNGEYDLYSTLGLADEAGCGNYQGGGNAHFIYNKNYPNKVIWVKYGNYNFLSGFENSGKVFIDWLKSIKYIGK